MSDQWHPPIIRETISALGGGVYVEIGVRTGVCYNDVAPSAAEAHAVDPVPPGYALVDGTFWEMTSDEFFDQYDGYADVVFIDGDHSYEQAKRDYLNALEILSPDGTIFLHDTWPLEPEHGNTGTVWRLAVELEQDSDTNTFTYRRYPGLTACQRPRLERLWCES